MKKKKFNLLVSLGLIALVIGGFYFGGRLFKLSSQKSNPTTTISPSVSGTADSSEEVTPAVTASPDVLSADECKAAKSLVTDFEALQSKRDAKAVLALFSPAAGSADQKTYDFLIGKDAVAPRLYSQGSTDFKLKSSNILQTEIIEGACVIKVQENRAFYSQISGDYANTKSKDCLFKIVKIDGKFKIERYYTESDSSKYAAFQ